MMRGLFFSDVYMDVAVVESWGPYYSPLRSHGIFLAAHRREFWSRKYLPTCLHQKDRTQIKRVHLLRVLFILLFCKICSLFDSHTKHLSKQFQNEDYVGLKGKHLIVFLLNKS